MIEITDPTDERIADYAALNDPALRKRYENRRGVFIAEGPNVVRQLAASRYPVRSLLLTHEQAAAMADVTAGIRAPVYVTTRELLRDVVRFRLHQGVLGCGGRLPERSVAEVLDGARRVAVLEAMNDHENMGVLFRTARGLGIDAVLLGPGSADPLYRRCVRVSMGHVLHVPHAVTGPVADTVAALHATGFRTVALTPAPDAVEFDRLPIGPDERLALLLGAEGPGLDAATQQAAEVRARIPMSDGVDSLNVATAAAIAFAATR
jgi:tRNA G18 (ribose-2'-O)-methylase SpoU